LPPTSLVTSLRRIVREMDPGVPVARVRTMEEIVDRSTARIRLTMLLLLLGAGAALLLGTIGIYSVISYSVAQRMPEFGVRLALGASPEDVKRLVLAEGMLLSLIGVGVGIVAALGLTRFMRGLLFHVSPSDPATFAAMSVLLLSVAGLASYLPARRAGRTDPAQVLKLE
ncbi:MAG: FtsX-like permease family protein, partial [Gemmatimonadaceae bacterium]